MQPWKKRQNHDCIFIMWKDKLHYLLLIKPSPTTFASTFEPNPLMPSSSETIRISRSSFPLSGQYGCYMEGDCAYILFLK